MGDYEDERENGYGSVSQLLKERERRPFSQLEGSGFGGCEGRCLADPQMNLFLQSLTKEEVSSEVRTGSEQGPLWRAHRARENCRQHYRCWPQHQRAVYSPLGQGHFLRLFHCYEKRGTNHSAPGLLSTISYMILSIVFSLSITPSYPWKALHLPSFLLYGYFHNGVSVLCEPLTQTLLY